MVGLWEASIQESECRWHMFYFHFLLPFSLCVDFIFSGCLSSKGWNEGKQCFCGSPVGKECQSSIPIGYAYTESCLNQSVSPGGWIPVNGTLNGTVGSSAHLQSRGQCLFLEKLEQYSGHTKYSATMCDSCNPETGC